MSNYLLFTFALAGGAANSLAAADPFTFWNLGVGKTLTPTQGIGSAEGKQLHPVRKVPDNC
jgi:hypothetical protein